MDSSFVAKVELVHAAFTALPDNSTMARERLLEGAFWLLDLMESDILDRHTNPPYLMAFINLLKDEASRLTKEPDSKVDAFTLSEAYSRLRMFAPPGCDSPEPEPMNPATY
jgi:hypothetical protein